MSPRGVTRSSVFDTRDYIHRRCRRLGLLYL